MIRSTLGFIYTPQLDKVLLIKKQKPAFHKNKLNGLGGKCDGKESYRKCLSREVLEESGLEIPQAQWHKMGVLSWDEWHVEIFAAILKEKEKHTSMMKTNEVAWYSTKHIPSNVIENLHWLIPLGIYCVTNKTPPVLKIVYPN
jgi:8-oxo-dGTP diphosphatase